jgi:hypothetical protein
MNQERRAILKEVAEGRLSPEEAAARIEGLEKEEAAAAAPSPGGVRSVRIESLARSVVVTGDVSVAEAVADGPHVAHREGDSLVIEDPEDRGLSFGFRFGGPSGFDFDRQPLVVRMNPRLALVADIQAGSLRTRGVRGPISAELQAGSARLEGFAAPIQIRLQAGSVRASGELHEGESEVRCEAGSVRIELDRRSDVRVSARSQMGKVELPGRGAEWVAGSGAATLALEVAMGRIQVSER